MLLGIDTATRWASVALYDGEFIIAECAWRSRENHTVELMPQIEHVLRLAHVSRGDLTAVAVTLGPGSFTGLRVGMSVAKGLALAGGIPLLGVATLDTVAQPFAYQSFPFWAVIPAGRGRYSLARYRSKDGAVERSSDYHLVDGAQLAHLVLNGGGTSTEAIAPGPAFVCGEIDHRLKRTLSEQLGGRVGITLLSTNRARAGVLAEMAWSRWDRGEADDVASLAPMYMPTGTSDGLSPVELSKSSQIKT